MFRTKEREEAILLITMDLKVCGKLLTHHQRGYGVDVEALRDRIPLRQGAGTGSRLVFGGYGGLRRRNSRSIVLLDVFRVYGHI